MAFYGDDLIVADGSGDFQTLAAFESYYDGVDISATDGVRARIKGTPGDSSVIYFAGWQSGQDADCKIVITADTGCGLQDRVGWTGADGSGNDAILPAQIIYFQETTNPIFLDIYNIEIQKLFSFGNTSDGSRLRIWNCLLRDSASHGIYAVGGANTVVYLANLLIRDWSTENYKYAINVNDADVTIYAWNITCDTGYSAAYMHASATDEFRNVVGFNTNGNVFYDNNVSDDYCAADDTTPDGANSIDSIVLDNNFTDYANEDYTVKDINADIYQAGADQPAWFNTLTGGKDIRGVNWHATTPSIGAFEYVAGGGATLPLKHPFLRTFVGPFGRF